MAYHLTSRDVLALGFMTFALFVGAGNIIFPPMVGLQAGEKVWIAAAGFLLTGVLLPVLAVIVLAKVGGGIEQLSAPIGKFFGLLLSIIAYLAVGPLFAAPRTATISYEVGIVPLVGTVSSMSLFIYCLVYFAIVIAISLYPRLLLDSIGKILAPIKMFGLCVLGISALLWPAGEPAMPSHFYQDMAFSKGFINGYLTMDTLGAMVFGIVIVNAARLRGVKNTALLVRYTKIAGLIAGVLLTLVYISLFNLGKNIGTLLSSTSNGADILHTYVQLTFGKYGSLFLGVLIFIACMATAVGLTCACAEFFVLYLPLSYRTLVWIIGICSMVISNLGLNKLITFSIPVLIGIYPPCIILIIMNFTLKWWKCASKVISPTILVSLLFGLLGAMKSSELLQAFIPAISKKLPLYDHDLAWVLPSLIVLVFFALYDRMSMKPVKSDV
ncbi:MAG: branched-chain amino acid transport system II carrier protein [Candidatus Arsenophonus melophagi]|nr:branched-chain amino acid transport system II carrier protein [Candidatus Arsenophonus melophagi]